MELKETRRKYNHILIDKLGYVDIDILTYNTYKDENIVNIYKQNIYTKLNDLVMIFYIYGKYDIDIIKKKANDIINHKEYNQCYDRYKRECKYFACSGLSQSLPISYQSE